MEKIFHTNRRQKKAGVLLSDKTDIKKKTIIRDKERNYIIIMRLIKKEGITFVNIYALNISTSKYMKQILKDLNG